MHTGIKSAGFVHKNRVRLGIILHFESASIKTKIAPQPPGITVYLPLAFFSVEISGKIAGHKSNMQKSIVFLCPSN